MVIDPSVLGEFGRQVQREHVRKVDTLFGTFVEDFLAIKPAIG